MLSDCSFHSKLKTHLFNISYPSMATRPPRKPPL
jgi:hypothetical protein